MKTQSSLTQERKRKPLLSSHALILEGSNQDSHSKDNGLFNIHGGLFPPWMHMVFRGNAKILHPDTFSWSFMWIHWHFLEPGRLRQHMLRLKMHVKPSGPKEKKQWKKKGWNGKRCAYCWLRPIHLSLHPQVTWLPCASFHFPVWPRHVSTARTDENPPGCSSWAWMSWMNGFHCESHSKRKENKEVVRYDDRPWVQEEITQRQGLLQTINDRKINLGHNWYVTFADTCAENIYATRSCS